MARRFHAETILMFLLSLTYRFVAPPLFIHRANTIDKAMACRQHIMTL